MRRIASAWLMCFVALAACSANAPSAASRDEQFQAAEPSPPVAADFVSLDVRQVPRQQSADLSTGCLPKLPRETPILAFGLYEGGPHTDVQLGNEAEPARLVTLVGPGGERQAVLLLMAYKATLWDFEQARTERIAAVIVAGYHHQAVLNLPATVPVVISKGSGTTIGSARMARRDEAGVPQPSEAWPRPQLVTVRQASPSMSCNGLGYAYKGGAALDRVVGNVEGMTGLRVTSFGSAYQSSGVRYGERLLPSDQVATATGVALIANASVRRALVKPGEAGLRDLLNSGAIRRVTARDVDAWARAATAAAPPAVLRPSGPSICRPARAMSCSKRSMCRAACTARTPRPSSSRAACPSRSIAAVTTPITI